jgi:hypothetical protein
VRVACPASEARGCRAVVRLTSAARLRLRAGLVTVRRRVALGHAAVHLGGGHGRLVTVTVPRAERPLVVRLGRLRVRIAVTATDASGNRATTTRVVLLRAPAHR